MSGGPRPGGGDDVGTFESLRPQLWALAYRMLGDVGRAHDMVQEAWLRWQSREVQVESARGFLITIVTRLSLNELDSARARREESHGSWLPEPVDVTEGGMAELGRLERLEQVSMAFLVLLGRLTAPERAVLLLHEVFDFSHDQVAGLLGRTPASCRKLLERARHKVQGGRDMLTTSREEHQRMLQAFVQAAQDGDTAALLELLAPDAVLISDAGPEGRTLGGQRSIPRPLEGAERVAAFVAQASRRSTLAVEPRELNGQPALVFHQDGTPAAALLLAISGGKIVRVFFHADPARLRFLGPGPGAPPGNATSPAPDPSTSPPSGDHPDRRSSSRT
jgi:RNA polymerase sigma-70 factor (ECF subfamily)